MENQFELVKASPQWDDRLLAVHLRELEAEEIDAAAKQKARQLLMNPRERMQQELDTFHCPDYEAEIGERKWFERYLIWKFDGSSYCKSLSYNLVYYFYSNFMNNPQYPRLETGEDQAGVFSTMTAEFMLDPWLVHTMALLHGRCGNRQESLRLWLMFLGKGEICRESGTYRNATGESARQACMEVWGETAGRLLGGVYSGFRKGLDGGDIAGACECCKLIERQKGNDMVAGDARNMLDRMTGDLIKAADNRCTGGRIEKGFTGDHMAAIRLAIRCSDEMPGNERLLVYLADKLCDLLRELSLQKMYAEAYKKTGFIKLIFKQLKNLGTETFVVSRSLEKLRAGIQNLGIGCYNDGKYNLCAAFLDMLPKDRPIPSAGGGTQTVSYIISQARARNSYDSVPEPEPVREEAPKKLAAKPKKEQAAEKAAAPAKKPAAAQKPASASKPAPVKKGRRAWSMAKKVAVASAAVLLFIVGGLMLIGLSISTRINSYPATVSSVSLGCGSDSSFLIMSDGSLWAWGDNESGQLGDGNWQTTGTYPKIVLEGVKAMSAGGVHTLALKEDGSLWAWGSNAFGALGDGTYGNIEKEPKLIIMDGVTEIAAGEHFSLALKGDGSLWAWGRNYAGQLGVGTTKDSLKPIKVLEGVKAVSAGKSHALALKEDGSLWTWGWNRHGQLGDGTTENSLKPIKVLEGVKAMSAGMFHTLALKEDGSLWAWGLNSYGQLGDSTTNGLKPMKVLEGVKVVSAGNSHTLALKEDGSLWAWGCNGSGQLGVGTTKDSLKPIKVLDSVKAVSAGANHTLALKKDGSLWAWGRNSKGQLGDGTRKNSLKPKKIISGISAKSAPPSTAPPPMVTTATEAPIAPVFTLPVSASTGPMAAETPAAAATQTNKPKPTGAAVNQSKKVPNVVGKAESAAVSALKAAGFKVMSVSEFSNAVAKGKVISQSPTGNSMSPANATVTIRVSRGTPVAVPNVVGMDRSAAESALAGLGLKVKIQEQYSDTVESGKVIGQDKAAGSSVEAGSTVKLTVSKGKDPIITVPNVVGKTEAEAMELLNAAGLQNINVEYRFSDEGYDKGLVCFESHTGEKVGADTLICIDVSRGKIPKESEWNDLDDVDGSIVRFQSVWEAYGFTTSVSYLQDDDMPSGTKRVASWSYDPDMEADLLVVYNP